MQIEGRLLASTVRPRRMVLTLHRSSEKENGFFEKVFNATLERVDATFMMVASIQEKNWNQRILTPERLQQFTARHAFQGGVDDQEIEHLQRCQFQRLNAAFGKVDGESGLAQTEAVVVASLEVVFDDQYLRLHTCHACELCR